MNSRSSFSSEFCSVSLEGTALGRIVLNFCRRRRRHLSSHRLDHHLHHISIPAASTTTWLPNPQAHPSGSRHLRDPSTSSSSSLASIDTILRTSMFCTTTSHNSSTTAPTISLPTSQFSNCKSARYHGLLASLGIMHATTRDKGTQRFHPDTLKQKHSTSTNLAMLG